MTWLAEKGHALSQHFQDLNNKDKRLIKMRMRSSPEASELFKTGSLSSADGTYFFFKVLVGQSQPVPSSSSRNKFGIK